MAVAVLAVAGLTCCIELRTWQGYPWPWPVAVRGRGWQWPWPAVAGLTRRRWRRATCCIKEAAAALVKEETAAALVEEVVAAALIEEAQGWR
jgi:hypothetical protein